MNIMLTGGTGYIGKEFIKKYASSFNIIALVRDTSNIEELKLLDCKIKKYENLYDIDEIFNEFKPLGVVHFASNVIVSHKNSDISGLIKSNIEFGTYLLELSKTYETKWFLNTGTFWQNYENEEYNPVNLYSAIKEALQIIAKYYTETSDLVFVTLKLNDTFGPNDPREKVFNLWKKFAKTGEVLAMTKGEQIIDISYIEDILSAYEILISHLNSQKANSFRNRVFAVKAQDRMSLKDLSKLFEEATNTKLNISWGGREYRQREVMSPWEDGECVPGWKAKFTLEEAIKKTVRDIK